jgi:hypothetical protein
MGVGMWVSFVGEYYHNSGKLATTHLPESTQRGKITTNRVFQWVKEEANMRAKPIALSDVGDAFLTLPQEDQEEIFNIGATFRLLELQKRLSRAQEKVEEFEAKYGMPLEELDSKGLPEDADYEVHEDYVEWHYWVRVREKTENTLDVLEKFATGHEPAR